MGNGALLGAPLTVESAEGSGVVDGLVPVARSERICCHVPVPSASPEKMVNTKSPLCLKYTAE
jgi:hypothetical protein